MNIQFVFVFEYVRNVASCTFAYRSFYFIKIISNWYLDWFWRNSYGFYQNLERIMCYTMFQIWTNLNHVCFIRLFQGLWWRVQRQLAQECDPSWTPMPLSLGGEETAMSGWHEGNLMVGLSQTLFSSVPMGRPITTRWKRPLVKDRPVKVKGEDFRVNLSRVRLTGDRFGWPSPHTCRKMWCHV